ncbi:MAG: AraC family transcriptional regulator [Spirochaetaceae bacterium]
MKVINYDNQIIAQIEYFDFLINNLNIQSLIHGFSTIKSDWRHKNITSPFHRLYFILDGKGVLQNSTTQIDLVPGQIYLIPANSTWTYSCDSTMDQFFIHLRINLMDGLDIFDNCSECLILPYSLDKVKYTINKMNMDSVASIIGFKSFLYEIISNFILMNNIELISHIKRTIKYKDLFQFIEKNKSAQLKVSDVVNYMSTSHSTLYKDLRLDTGYSIKYYINKKITESACELLLLSGQSIKQIAFSLDFKDQYYFSRFFKKQMGLSPSVYRSSNNPTKLM